MLCHVQDGTCDCGKPKFIPEIIRPVAVPFCTDVTMMSTLFRVIIQQNEMIKSIAEQTKLVLEKLSGFSETTTTVTTSPEEVITAAQLQKVLCGNENDHPYRLELVSEMPSPAYKERSFSLIVQIVNKTGEKVTLPESLNFKVMLFTTENPPKVMKINTSGDKILKGNTEAQGNSTVFFRKIAVKEVTSHFRNGCFFFVVTAKDSKFIRPLIFENFVVKARKINNEPASRKKMKVDDSTSIEE
jgi:hypothetical protein